MSLETRVVFIHASDQKFAEQFAPETRCLMMRADRLISPWVNEIRATFKDENVLKTGAGTYTFWAVPWEFHATALEICQKHFSDISIERESILGHSPFMPDEAQAVARLVEPVNLDRFVDVKSPSPVKAQEQLLATEMTVAAVGDNSQTGHPEILIKHGDSTLNIVVGRDKAAAFGKLLFEKVKVTISTVDGE